MRRLNPFSKAWLGGVLLGAIFAALLVPLLAIAAEGPTTHRVVIEKFAFVPASITIKAGDRVEWINRDIVPHTATDGEGDWDTANLVKGATGAISFSGSGTWAYFCAYHPNMRGEIIVLDE